MKKISVFSLFAILSISLLQACGPSEEELRAKEQARLDSLQQAQQEMIAQQMAAARQDSIDQAMQAAMEEAAKNPYNFEESGSYAVQVGAFRSEVKANNYLAKWSDRDYPNAYVVKSGEEQYGDVWFRLRVGFFGNKEDAAKLGSELASEINSSYWVSKVR